MHNELDRTKNAYTILRGKGGRSKNSVRRKPNHRWEYNTKMYIKMSDHVDSIRLAQAKFDDEPL